MTITRYSAALAAMLITLPALSHAKDATNDVTVATVSEDALITLDPDDRAAYEYSVRNAESPAEIDAILAETRTRIEARRVFNADVPSEVRGTVTDETRATFEARFMEAKTEEERAEIRAGLKELVEAEGSDDC